MTGNLNYYKKLFNVILRDPLKFLGVLRLKTGGEHRRGKYYKRQDGFSGPPITVAIRPSYRCNLSCLQCGQWGEHGIFKDIPPDTLAKEELTTEEIKNFIKDVSQFRPYIYFTGGEPLLRRDLFDLIRFASSRHLITSVSSNSILLTELAEGVVSSGLDYFYSSLDAPDCSNNDIRRGRDSFQKAVIGLKKMLQIRKEKWHKLPIVQIQTIILKENQDKLYEMAKFVNDELKADVWGLQLRVFATPEANRKTEQIYRDKFGINSVYWQGFVMDTTVGIDYRILEEELKRIKSRQWNFRLRLYSPLGLPEFTFKDYFEQPKDPMVEPPCMYPWAFTQLQPNGDIAICGSQPDYIIGNIKKEAFVEIWNNEKARNFRKFIQSSPLPVCSRCFGTYIFSGYK